MFRRWRHRCNADDFADEIQAHLAHEEARLREAGLAPDEARRQARRAFGNVTRVREDAFDVGPRRWLSALWLDVHYGVRLMRRSPGFAATAVLVLSLGIGVNTALFSIVNALFFKPLAVERPEELVYFYGVNGSGEIIPAMSPTYIDFFREQGAALFELGGHGPNQPRVSVDGLTELVWGEVASGNYFELLGVRPAIGRTLGPADDDPANTELAMVISHDFWVTRLGASREVLGKEVRVQDKFFRVVGVMPTGFAGLTDPMTPGQFWVTGTQFAGRDQRLSYSDGPFGRMKPGVTFDQVQAFLAAKTPLLKEMLWNESTSVGQARERLRQSLDRMDFRVYRAVDVVDPRNPKSTLIPARMLAALTAVVGLVLLIASANIAGLLLARGMTRTGEVAVRRALGAGGLRLTRQLLTESTLLSTAGGVAGLAIAWNLVEAFRSLVPSRYVLDVTLDWRVLAFAALVCVLTGVLVGLAPALQAARVNVLEALGSGIVGSRTVRGRLRRWIVVPQIAMSLVLLVVAGVHVRALVTIELNDVGYQTDDGLVLTFGRWEPEPNLSALARMSPEERTGTREEGARTMRDFNRRVFGRVAEVPGVARLAITATLPLHSSTADLQPVARETAYLAGEAASAGAWKTVVSEGYFDVMDISVIRGRTFEARDEYHQPKVAVISEALERQLWRGRPSIGDRIAFVDPAPGMSIEWLEVIGVVADVRPVLDDTGVQPRVYVPLRQQWRGTARNLLIRGYGSEDANLIEDVKRAVVGSDAYAEVAGVKTMRQAVGEILYPRRIAAGILLVSGSIGLLLASIGLYGVVSFSVAQRLREIGIRATLGATRRDILALVLREGALVAGIGCAIGLGLAVVALRLTEGVIAGLPTVDVAMFVVMPALLAAVVTTACYVPARRAAAVDPVAVLR